MTEKTLKPGWKMVKFGDVVRLNTDRIADPLAAGIERYVGLEHITPEDLHIHSWGLVAKGTTFTNYFKPGQVLFGKRRAYQRKVAMAEFEGVCSGDIYVFESKDPEVLLPGLLPFICQSEGFYNYAVNTSAGSLSPRTNWSHLAGYEFALAPTNEQRRVANLLLAMEDVIEKSRGLVGSITKLKASIRMKYFDCENNQKVSLKNLCEPKGIQIGPFGSQLHASDYVPNGVPVIMPANMTDDVIDENGIATITPQMANSLSHHKVQRGDILLPRRGELDRRAFIRPEQEGWLCGTGALRVRIKKGVNTRAVFHALSSAETVGWLKNHAVGTTMPNLNTTIVSNIPLSLPPKDEIDQIVETLENLDHNLHLAKKKLDDELIMKREFLGRLLE